ncbi:hypothetical protein F5J12DRAFT_830325 [Pisolithus orientalis]|uniref:uncharacterized protein n=1 Tax=Pisolithus orientalis TaxID=936130 RepID=UPI00222464D0|nr:uncharacterized protein F5J12DRAFT_830325 [Pisolithus orientalis]KAI6007721.1 hypothetical protein F5J12DRAFT_830325 [Pisolithus orientalis]
MPFVVDSYNTASTSVQLPYMPSDTTGIERIMLAAQGDLQRLLSTFFARPIFVEPVYADTSPRLHSASPDYAITQSRRVHLVCAGKVVCVATSTVTLTSPVAERLFLDDKFPIGQTIRKLGQSPRFSLLSVETLTVGTKREIRRTYTLETEGFSAEILEVFPDRDMFIRGEAWLLEGQPERDLTCASVTESYLRPEWLSLSVVH